MSEINGGEKLGAMQPGSSADPAEAMRGQETPALDPGLTATGGLIVASGLPPETHDRWKAQFVNPGNTSLQSIWRRHQFDWNSDLSGYRPGDARRKVLQYKDGYSLSEGENGYELAITEPYLWVTVALPTEEVRDYEDMVLEALQTGGWEEAASEDEGETRTFVRGGLVFEYGIKEDQEQDLAQDRTFPDDYQHFEATFRGKEVELSDKERFLPWGVVNASYRTKDERQEPRLVEDLGELQDLLPMQVELGCGPSVEAGLPPLHYLHEIYRIQDREGKFMFKPEADDLLVEMLTRTGDFYQKAGLIYGRSLTAELTPFYKLLKGMHDSGIVVGDVITNSIDGLPQVAGLPEQNVRRYERSKLVPNMDFDPRAKSLLVVGSHADRRLVRKAARKRGLQVIYVDPEGYLEDGEFVPDPMEAPQAEDMHVKMTADDFAKEWERALE